ncbi:SH3 and multiple ankyrin repeat domains protein 1-like [Choloepus didactylus]|uniref:SH3 and multiple ankyrin repeat domains protein 1-like n=1 Tax=Choloepus didactylus TaxID=27675 RepID=UPI00189CD02F|nr:SH3 and multiple ankyrin repeat domains protein 1-like [Choloepus didactylus]
MWGCLGEHLVGGQVAPGHWSQGPPATQQACSQPPVPSQGAQAPGPYTSSPGLDPSSCQPLPVSNTASVHWGMLPQPLRQANPPPCDIFPSPTAAQGSPCVHPEPASSRYPHRPPMPLDCVTGAQRGGFSTPRAEPGPSQVAPASVDPLVASASSSTKRGQQSRRGARTVLTRSPRVPAPQGAHWLSSPEQASCPNKPPTVPQLGLVADRPGAGPPPLRSKPSPTPGWTGTHRSWDLPSTSPRPPPPAAAELAAWIVQVHSEHTPAEPTTLGPRKFQTAVWGTPASGACFPARPPPVPASPGAATQQEARDTCPAYPVATGFSSAEATARGHSDPSWHCGGQCCLPSHPGPRLPAPSIWSAQSAGGGTTSDSRPRAIRVAQMVDTSARALGASKRLHGWGLGSGDSSSKGPGLSVHGLKSKLGEHRAQASLTGLSPSLAPGAGGLELRLPPLHMGSCRRHSQALGPRRWALGGGEDPGPGLGEVAGRQGLLPPSGHAVGTGGSQRGQPLCSSLEPGQRLGVRRRSREEEGEQEGCRSREVLPACQLSAPIRAHGAAPSTPHPHPSLPSPRVGLRPLGPPLVQPLLRIPPDSPPHRAHGARPPAAPTEGPGRLPRASQGPGLGACVIRDPRGQAGV